MVVSKYLQCSPDMGELSAACCILLTEVTPHVLGEQKLRCCHKSPTSGYSV